MYNDLQLYNYAVPFCIEGLTRQPPDQPGLSTIDCRNALRIPSFSNPFSSATHCSGSGQVQANATHTRGTDVWTRPGDPVSSPLRKIPTSVSARAAVDSWYFARTFCSNFSSSPTHSFSNSCNHKRSLRNTPRNQVVVEIAGVLTSTVATFSCLPFAT